jgi:nucleotide-binding universal stress UspA family protein
MKGTGYRRVLIPTDFSPDAAASVERCPEIAGVEQVVLLHVTPPNDTAGSAGKEGSPEAERIRARLAEAARPLREAGLTVTVRVEASHGPVIARTILQVAQETGTDLILIGARRGSRSGRGIRSP